MPKVGVRTTFNWRGALAKRAVREAADVGLGLAAVVIRNDSSGRAPVRTGRLRDSHDTERKRLLLHSIVATAPYAAFVEFGTVRMAAQPFLRPALATGRATIIKLVGQRVKRATAPFR